LNKGTYRHAPAAVLPTLAANVPAFFREDEKGNLSNEIAHQSQRMLYLSIAIQCEQLKELDYDTFMANDNPVLKMDIE
jgi:hypothetical protein